MEKQADFTVKQGVPAVSQPLAYQSTGNSNSPSIEYSTADDNASTIPHYSGLETEHHDADTVLEDDVPPAYHQLVVGDGDVSAEVMRNGRISMFINSAITIPNRLPSLEPERTHASSLQSTTYAESEHPILNIVIQVVGSQGDAQPFIALGKELQRSGHRVRVATHTSFEISVRESGLEFFSIDGGLEQPVAYMINNPGIISTLAGLRNGEIASKRKMILQMLEGFWNSCIEPDAETNRPFVADAIIANPPSFAHMHCAQALGIPLHLICTIPCSPTKAFPHPLANIRKSSHADIGTHNFLSYGLVELMTWQGLEDIINTWRETSLSLEPIRAMMGVGLADYLHVPLTYFWSPSLLPKPSDWGPNIDVCGFLSNEPSDYTPPGEVEEFLRAGPAPIYIGIENNGMDNPAVMARIILSAVQEAGVRATISKQWSTLGTDYQGPNVLFIDDCPPEWLFKRVCAVVHDGEARITACGLRNGCPTAIIPVYGEQSFWGDRVAAAGAGPRPIDHKSLTITNLVAAIRICLKLETQQAAQRIADGMSREFAVSEAVKSFHRQLPVKEMRCDLIPRKPAVWCCEMANRRQLKLSDEAAYILMEQKQLKMENMKVYRCQLIEIENERWDPLTAGSSSLIDTISTLTSNGKNVFVQPYKELKKVQSLRSDSLVEGTDMRGGGKHGHRNAVAAAAAAGVAGKSVGKISGGLAKGVLLDLPVAMADGFHAMPMLYGDKKMKRGPVSDWKSGMVVGGKAFAYGFYDGFTGIVTAPAKGAVNDGGVGFAKGLVTGTLGVLFKPGAAMLGLVGYPLLGMFKSISSLHASPAESKILLAKQIQGSEIERRLRPSDETIQQVLRAFAVANRS